MDRPPPWLEIPMRGALWGAAAAGLLMMAQVAADVLGRTLFGRPIPGTAEIVSHYYMVAVAFLPWTWLAHSGGQIRVDLVVRLLPDRLRAWSDIAVGLGLAGYLAVFAWQAGLQAIRQTGRGELQQAGAMYLPVWPTRWLLPLAAGLTALLVALRVLAALRDRVRR